jgi:Mg2+ and Co2+ transporter CorA
MIAHAHFDPMWKDISLPRKEAYKWLAKELEIPLNECHIGVFDVDTCKRTVRLMEIMDAIAEE